MTLYAQKQTPFEAVQMTRDRMKNISLWPRWLIDASEKNESLDGAFYTDSKNNFRVRTQGVGVIVYEDYYIINNNYCEALQPMKDQLIVAKPITFESSYVIYNG